MEFTNEVLKNIEDKQVYNLDVSKYFYRLDLEFGMKGQHKYLRISNNVKDCLNYWFWDFYRVNRVLDLQKVSRCKNRFCPNCRKFDLSRALNNLSKPFRYLIEDGYYPFLMTLTVPNCSGSSLSDTLDKMHVSFKRFWVWFNSLSRGKFFGRRYSRFFGAIRCIEVNYSKVRGDYHPHYHLLVLLDVYNSDLFSKYIEGEYSNNRSSFNMYSDFDIQIRKLWTIAFNDLDLSFYDKLNILDIYKCDIKEMDSSGVYEVMKYVFKDTDLVNYNVFKDFYFSLYNRRIRQGYGLLYNVKLENDSDGKKQDIDGYLLEDMKDSPSELITTQIKTLYTSYANYIKISRFNKDGYVNKID